MENKIRLRSFSSENLWKELDFWVRYAYNLAYRERDGGGNGLDGCPPPRFFGNQRGKRMALTESGMTGRDTQQTADVQTGLLTQNPESMTQLISREGVDPAAGADALNMGVSFLQPFMIEVLVNAEETGSAATGVLTALAAGGSDVFPVYDSAATALTTGAPFKFQVLDVFALALDENTKGTDTVQLMHVAADGTTETAITDAMVMNVDDDTLIRMLTCDQDACVISVTENLRVDVILDNSTSTDHRAWKVFIWCSRCLATE